MRFTHLVLENWKNFLRVDVELHRRVFLVGPNASGKSNLLDAFRFLRDIATSDGGLQHAVGSVRPGVSKLRSLHARRHSTIGLQVSVELAGAHWLYALEIGQDNQRRPTIHREEVLKDEVSLLRRPDAHDREDSDRLRQTHLEQVNSNKEFRELADFFANVRYLHVVPQLIRETDRVTARARDPYGSDFLEQIARTPLNTQRARLRKVGRALRVAVPQLRDLELRRDEVSGVPHLEGRYEHWRPNAGWQREKEFSDGTLRLIGLLWAFLDGNSPLLLEEPEMSLHSAVVRQVPRIMDRVGRKTKRQVIISTHSDDLLRAEGISPEEVLLLVPGENGTEVREAHRDAEIAALLQGGVTVAVAVLPRTAPENATQLPLFGD